jgi:diacylglycerol kinase family enzyme
MKRRFLFLLNPRAGVQKGQPLLQLIQQKCEAAVMSYSIEHTVDADYLTESKINVEQITDVIIAGGDGTISAVTKPGENCR